MKEIKLFVSVKLTSLSPDAQVISLGIVSEDIPSAKKVATAESQFGNIDYYKAGTLEFHSKSFYSEFSDFNINRCDDWVKENVVGKLKYRNYEYPQKMPDKIIANIFDLKGMGKGTAFQHESVDENDMRVFHDPNPELFGDTLFVKTVLKEWLKQFSDYQIQFVADCGTFDFYHLLQLISEWDEVENEEGWSSHCPTCGTKGVMAFKIGLPKLPSNISLVPLDLNDLIAFKKGISVKEAFELNREDLALGHHSEGLMKRMKILDNVAENELARNPIEGNKHNSLWDSKIIKSIYEKLM